MTIHSENNLDKYIELRSETFVNDAKWFQLNGSIEILIHWTLHGTVELHLKSNIRRQTRFDRFCVGRFSIIVNHQAITHKSEFWMGFSSTQFYITNEQISKFSYMWIWTFVLSYVNNSSWYCARRNIFASQYPKYIGNNSWTIQHEQKYIWAKFIKFCATTGIACIEPVL